MSVQLFRKTVPKPLLLDLLESVCLKTDRYYLVDMNAFRKLSYQDELRVPWCAALLEYYHRSKHFYVTREMTYNSFVNLVRQLCKQLKIPFESRIKYIDAKYQIDYYIYYAKVADEEGIDLFEVEETGTSEPKE